MLADGTRPGVVIGLGLGALIDGFVLHQLLQWHHLWSLKTPSTTLGGLEANVLADGIFHMTSLAVLVAGIFMLARAAHPVDRRALGADGLVGWGAFNILDHLVFHLALEAHHIRAGVDNYEVYDWSFFAGGLGLVAVGVALRRRAV